MIVAMDVSTMVLYVDYLHWSSGLIVMISRMMSSIGT